MSLKKIYKSDFFGAIAIIVGTCVGAGIFGLPYVINQVGALIGIFYLIILGFVTVLICLAYGEIILRTKGTHQFTEYARIYLGKTGKNIAFLALAVGFYGGMIAYLMGVSNFLFNLISPFCGGSIFIYRLVYFVFIATALFFGLGAIKKLEKVLTVLMICFVIALFIFGFSFIKTDNLTSFNISNIFIPYGVILFAFACSSAVPDMKNVLADKKYLLKKAIIIGVSIPLFVYLIFSLTIVGISGSNTTENAIYGLAASLGPVALIIGSIFACITMTTSFLTVGLILKEVYHYDFKINKYLAWLIVISPPFIVLNLNLFTFIGIIAVSGAIIGGLDGILTIKMYNKAKIIGQRKPEYELKLTKVSSGIMYGVFILGIFYELFMVIKKIVS